MSLVIPLDCEARKRPQQVSLRAMLAEMLDCLIDQQPRLLLRTLRAEHRHEGRLAGFRILAGALPGCVRVAGMIDEVVGDLESEADVARVAAVWSARFRLAGEP